MEAEAGEHPLVREPVVECPGPEPHAVIGVDDGAARRSRSGCPWATDMVLVVRAAMGEAANFPSGSPVSAPIRRLVGMEMEGDELPGRRTRNGLLGGATPRSGSG